jgi:hypothetical protein
MEAYTSVKSSIHFRGEERSFGKIHEVIAYLYHELFMGSCGCHLGKLTDLTKLKPLGTVCWTHVMKARRRGQTDIYSREEQGRLVGYDDNQDRYSREYTFRVPRFMNFMTTVISSTRHLWNVRWSHIHRWSALGISIQRMG